MPETRPARGPAGQPPIPSLEVLGDRMEAAAARSMTAAERPAGGSPRAAWARRSPWVVVPALGAFIGLVVLVSVVLAGSRNDLGSGTAEADVLTAMKRSSSLSTGRFHLTLTLDPRGAATVVDAVGSYDAGAGTMQATLDASAVLTAAGAVDPAVTAGSVPPGGLKAEMIVDRGAVYVTFPGRARWARVSSPGLGRPAARSSAVGTDPQLSPSGSSPGDPSGLLGLAGGVEGVESVGSETVAGVDTIHYRGTVDIARAYADLGREDQRRLDDGLALVGGGVPRTGRLPVDVWVDGEGLVRRLSSSVHVGSLGLGQSGAGDAAFVMELSGLGSAVSIHAPDPSTVDG